MADAPAILSAHLIAELRRLEGRAKITFPYGVTTHPRVERVVKVPLSDWELAFNTADEEVASCLLKQQEKVAEDDHYAHVYRRYELLPGPTISSTFVNESGLVVTREVTAVAPGSVTPAAALLVLNDSVTASTSVEAQRVRDTVPSLPAFTSTFLNGAGLLVTRTEQDVAPGSVTPADGLLVESDSLITNHTAKARHVRETVASRPTFTSTFLNNKGVVVTRTEQTVAPGSVTPTDGLLVESDSLTQTAASKATHQRDVVASHPTFTTTFLNDDGILVTRTEQTVAPGSVTPTGGFLVESDTLTQTSASKSTHQRDVLASRPTLTSRYRNRELAGGQKVNEVVTFVEPGSGDDVLPTITSSAVLDARLEQLSQFVSKKTVITINGSQPTLIDWEHDRLIGNIKVEKTVVSASVVSALPATGPVQTDNVITEYQALTMDLYLRIISTFPDQTALNALTRDYPITANYRFPDLLRSAQFIIPYIFSTDESDFDYDIGLRLKIERGHSGQFNGRVWEYYTYDPDATIAALAAEDRQVQVFAERADILQGIHAEWTDTTAEVALKNFSIPETIRDAMTISGVLIDKTGATAAAPSTFNQSIQASTPTLTEFLAMETLVIDIDVKSHVGGIYLVRVVKIDNPHYTAP